MNFETLKHLVRIVGLQWPSGLERQFSRSWMRKVVGSNPGPDWYRIRCLSFYLETDSFVANWNDNKQWFAKRRLIQSETNWNSRVKREFKSIFFELDVVPSNSICSIYLRNWNIDLRWSKRDGPTMGPSNLKKNNWALNMWLFRLKRCHHLRSRCSGKFRDETHGCDNLPW